MSGAHFPTAVLGEREPFAHVLPLFPFGLLKYFLTHSSLPFLVFLHCTCCFTELRSASEVVVFFKRK